MTLRSPSLVRLMGEPRVLINRSDVERLGVKDNDWAEIETRRVAVPLHSKANKITSPALNKAGTPKLNFSAARLKKLRSGKPTPDTRR